MADIYWDVSETTWGPVFVAAADDCVIGCTLPGRPHKAFLKELQDILPDERFAKGSSPMLKEAFKQIKEYLTGKRMLFEVPIYIFGTDFQRKVWKALVEIPYGHTVSYADIAKKIKQPKAVRAVGTANGKNRAPMLVPCHRVVGADGALGGFSGGLDLKRKLLDLEFKRIAS